MFSAVGLMFSAVGLLFVGAGSNARAAAPRLKVHSG